MTDREHPTYCTPLFIQHAFPLWPDMVHTIFVGEAGMVHDQVGRMPRGELGAYWRGRR